MISTRSSVIRGLVLCAMSLIAHSFDPMGGYTPVSEVGPHSRVALDICKLEELVAANDYTQAAQVFANGLSAVNGDGTLRTLEAMAEKQSTSPVWQQYRLFHNDVIHLDTFLQSALQGTDDMWVGTDDPMSKNSARQQAIKKGARDNIMPLYVIHELDAAIEKVQAGNADPAPGGAAHNWDEGFAFYYGAQDTQACGAPFNTISDLATSMGTVNAATGAGKAHEAILAAFQEGLQAILTNNLAGVQAARDTIVKQLRIPYLQAALKYSSLVDTDLATGSADTVKHQAEAFVYWRAVAAQVAAHHAEGAADLMERFNTANAPAVGNYEATYCVIDSTLEALGTTWAEIGQYTGTSPVEDCAAYGKYVPASNVDVHAKIVLDVCLLEEKVGALRTPGGSDKDFLGASEVYNNGFNAVNADGSKRTLIDMAKKASTSPMWQKYVAYHTNNAEFIHDFITSALDGTPSSRWEGSPSRVSARQQAVKKGARDLLLPLYVMHELDEAINKVSAGNIDVNSGAPHNWDEGYAFYSGLQNECAGGLVGAPMGTAAKHAAEFTTMSFGRPDVHRAIVAAFKAGLAATIAGDLTAVSVAREEIAKQLRIPALQGMIKYAHEVDQDLKENEDADAIKHRAEGWVYFTAVAAQMAENDPEGAADLAERFAPEDAPKEGNYIAVYCAVEASLPFFKTSWQEVGRFTGTSQVNCTTRELKTGEATVPCSVSRIADFTAQCSTKAAIAPLLADSDTNKDALCDLKHDAVKCMHERAATFDCRLPSFGLPVYVKKEVYSDRRRSLLQTAAVSDVMIDAQLGMDDLVTVDCCEFFQDLKPKKEVYSDRRRALLAGDDLDAEVCEECEESFCTAQALKDLEDDGITGNKYFSFPALFILYREVVEAALIVAVLLQFMDRTKNFFLKKWVWIGALTGVVVSLGIGIVFIAMYYVASNNIFSGNTAYYFEGVVSIIACIMITILAFMMLRMWNLQEVWEAKLEAAMGEDREMLESGGDKTDKDREKQRKVVFMLAFSAVFREGIETVVFLAGIGANTEPTALPLAGFTGVVLGLLTGYLVFRGGGSLKTLKTLFQVTFVILLVVAGGVLLYGTHELTEAEAFGTWKVPESQRPWQNEALWDISGCCSHKDKDFFVMMRAIVGYTSQPTAVEAIVYCSYWVLVGLLFYHRYKSGSLTRKKGQHVHGEEDNANTLGAEKEYELKEANDKGHKDADMMTFNAISDVSAV